MYSRIKLIRYCCLGLASTRIRSLVLKVSVTSMRAVLIIVMLSVVIVCHPVKTVFALSIENVVQPATSISVNVGGIFGSRIQLHDSVVMVYCLLYLASHWMVQ